MDMINNFIGLTLQLSVPIILGALCGTIAERGGIILLGVEGIMLIGAFAGHLSCWEFQEACSDFIMSTRLVPNTVDIHEIWEAWYLLALSHYLLGEYEKAADAYQTCYGLARGDDIITTTAAI